MSQEFEARYHYQLIQRAIAEIDCAAAVDPSAPDLSLEALATKMGLSSAHFQRLFSQWVGVSPKRYQQYLKLDFARTLLATQHSTLKTATATGLSGPSRLHDLFVTWEAMTPGEYARGGEGLDITWGEFDSPFGPSLIMATPRGICAITFHAEIGLEAALEDITRRWPKARYHNGAEALRPQAEAIFAQKGRAHLHLIGAPFQIKVWEALLAIPTAHVSSYSDICEAIGTPKAQRAVGTAVGRNPISLLIPCHRVLRRDGALGGYHWGLTQKRAMLAYEAARHEHVVN